MQIALYPPGSISGGANADIVATPRTLLHSRPVMVAHGAGATAMVGWRDQTAPGGFGLFEDIVRLSGCNALASDFGGPTAFGNDTAVASVENARSVLGISKIIGVGFSMGGITLMNYARTYPGKVAALYLIAPLSDLDDVRNRNVLGFKSAIEAAWGISSTDPLPARSNPTYDANAALIASGGFPIRMAYSTADTVVTPATVTTLATKLSATTRVISTTQAHGDGELPLVSRSDLLNFIQANAA